MLKNVNFIFISNIFFIFIYYLGTEYLRCPWEMKAFLEYTAILFLIAQERFFFGLTYSFRSSHRLCEQNSVFLKTVIYLKLRVWFFSCGCYRGILYKLYLFVHKEKLKREGTEYLQEFSCGIWYNKYGMHP